MTIQHLERVLKYGPGGRTLFVRSTALVILLAQLAFGLREPFTNAPGLRVRNAVQVSVLPAETRRDSEALRVSRAPRLNEVSDVTSDPPQPTRERKA